MSRSFDEQHCGTLFLNRHQPPPSRGRNPSRSHQGGGRKAGDKSGGFRTIYVFGGRHMPIFLLTVCAKNAKANLTPKEWAAAVQQSKEIVSMWSKRQWGARHFFGLGGSDALCFPEGELFPLQVFPAAFQCQQCVRASLRPFASRPLEAIGDDLLATALDRPLTMPTERVPG